MDYLERFYQLRKANKMRQEDIAGYLGVSRVTYTQYEGGKRKMDIETFVRMCRLFNVTPNEMLGFDE